MILVRISHQKYLSTTEVLAENRARDKYVALLTKFVRSRWLDIGQILFCVFMGRDEVEVHKNAKKKKERGQYPAILTEQAWSIKVYYMDKRLHQVLPSLCSWQFCGRSMTMKAAEPRKRATEPGVRIWRFCGRPMNMKVAEPRKRAVEPSHSSRGFAALFCGFAALFCGSAAQTPTKPPATQAKYSLQCAGKCFLS